MEGGKRGFLRHWKGWKVGRDLPHDVCGRGSADMCEAQNTNILPILPTLPEKGNSSMKLECSEKVGGSAIIPRGFQQGSAPFQSRVAPWMQECFGAVISNDRLERGDRLLEECLELLQSGGYPPDRVAQLVDYTWHRPPGEPAQEVGGVMVTLAAYCLAHDLDMHDAGEAELARIWTKVPQIRAKQAAKVATIGASPLPVAS